MNDLIRKKDLIDNPTTRVPICLCLDTSGSMGRIVEGETRATGEQFYEDGQMWTRVTGGISAIDKLTEGVRAFYSDLRKDEVAQYSAEICIVTFGGRYPRLVMDFISISSIERDQEIPKLESCGDTPIGEAVNMALDCLEKRKEEYKKAGVDYFQPWLVLMTDGSPDGSDPSELERAIQRTSNLVNSKKLTVFPIGIGDEADMDTLKRFSPLWRPLHLKDMKFKEFFLWLSQSVSRTSMSIPGEKIPLDKDAIEGWGTL